MMSPDWIVGKKATINPKNEKDNECFKQSIIAGLNYNKIKEKELKKKTEKFKRVYKDFYLTKDTGKNLKKKILQKLLMLYLHHITVKK